MFHQGSRENKTNCFPRDVTLSVYCFTSERSSLVKYFQDEKRNFESQSGHAVFYLLYRHQCNSKPFHLNILILRKARFSM